MTPELSAGLWIGHFHNPLFLSHSLANLQIYTALAHLKLGPWRDCRYMHFNTCRRWIWVAIENLFLEKILLHLAVFPFMGKLAVVTFVISKLPFLNNSKIKICWQTDRHTHTTHFDFYTKETHFFICLRKFNCELIFYIQSSICGSC